MASLEVSTAAESRPLPPSDEAKQDAAAAAPPLPITHPSNPDENEAQEPDESQAKEIKEVDKGKGKHKKKHGVMSLPAEIRETYAFQSFAANSTVAPIHSTDLTI